MKRYELSEAPWTRERSIAEHSAQYARVYVPARELSDQYAQACALAREAIRGTPKNLKPRLTGVTGSKVGLAYSRTLRTYG